MCWSLFSYAKRPSVIKSSSPDVTTTASMNLATALDIALHKTENLNEAFSCLESKASSFLALVSAALATEVTLGATWREAFWFIGPWRALLMFSLILIAVSASFLVVSLSIRNWIDTPKWSDFLDPVNLESTPQNYVSSRLEKMRTASEKNAALLGHKAAWFQAGVVVYAVGVLLFLLPFAAWLFLSLFSH